MNSLADVTTTIIVSLLGGAIAYGITALANRKKTNAEAGFTKSKKLSMDLESLATMSGRIDCLEQDHIEDRKLILDLRQEVVDLRDWAEKLSDQVVDLGGVPVKYHVTHVASPAN